MRNITITDMTMRQSGKGLSFREKIELVKHLDKLGAGVIEVSPITSPKVDRLLKRILPSPGGRWRRRFIPGSRSAHR